MMLQNSIIFFSRPRKWHLPIYQYLWFSMLWIPSYKKMAGVRTYLADGSLRAARFSVWRARPLLGVGGRGSWSCCSHLGLRLPLRSLLEGEVHPESDGSGSAVLLKSIQVPGREEGNFFIFLTHLVSVVWSAQIAVNPSVRTDCKLHIRR